MPIGADQRAVVGGQRGGGLVDPRVEPFEGFIAFGQYGGLDKQFAQMVAPPPRRALVEHGVAHGVLAGGQRPQQLAGRGLGQPPQRRARLATGGKERRQLLEAVGHRPLRCGEQVPGLPDDRAAVAGSGEMMLPRSAARCTPIVQVRARAWTADALTGSISADECGGGAAVGTGRRLGQSPSIAAHAYWSQGPPGVHFTEQSATSARLLGCCGAAPAQVHGAGASSDRDRRVVVAASAEACRCGVAALAQLAVLTAGLDVVDLSAAGAAAFGTRTVTA